MKKRLIKTTFIIISTILLLFLLYKTVILINLVCPFKHFLNIYCVGCGTTRMITSLLKLEIYQAFRYNPFIFILMILLFIYIIYFLYFYIRYNNIKKLNIKVIIIIVVIAFIYMLLRNLDIFKFLRPTIIK